MLAAAAREIEFLRGLGDGGANGGTTEEVSDDAGIAPVLDIGVDDIEGDREGGSELRSGGIV
jgi:hypothetical protein